MNSVVDESAVEPIVDSFGRIHNNLRVGVTDRCNIRCFYCMPNEEVQFLPHKDVLSFEEIARLVRVVATAGVNRVRLTGGEPLVRSQLPVLVEMLAEVPGIEDLAMTTNGILLAKHAQDLRNAGLDRLNISLDSIDPVRFEQIARRKGLDRVLEGISAAQQAGFERIRINAVALSGITEHEAVPLARFCRENNLELRFIEFMPLDAEENWGKSQVITGETIRQILESEFGKLIPVSGFHAGQPANDFEYSDGSGRVGFIDPVSQPFCASCNRMRITADGKMRNCLFSAVEWDIRKIIRAPLCSDADLLKCVRESITAKKAGHGIDTPDFQRPQKAMYQIGG